MLDRGLTINILDPLNKFQYVEGFCALKKWIIARYRNLKSTHTIDNMVTQ